MPQQISGFTIKTNTCFGYEERPYRCTTASRLSLGPPRLERYLNLVEAVNLFTGEKVSLKFQGGGGLQERLVDVLETYSATYQGCYKDGYYFMFSDNSEPFVLMEYQCGRALGDEETDTPFQVAMFDSQPVGLQP